MERLTKRLEDGQAVMDCAACGVSWHKKRKKDIPYCTALFCRNRLKERLAAYEDTGLDPEEIADFMKRWEQTVEIGGMLKKYGINHIWDIIQAEQDGRLVMFPCKVGDTVYVIRTMTHSEALKSGVPEFRDKWSNRKYARKRAQYRPMIVEERKMVKTYFSKIGKTVFLTREEAEAALKGGDLPENRTDRR